MAALLASFAGKVADAWSVALLSPAFAFWGGGVAVYAAAHGWEATRAWAAGLGDAALVALLAAGLLLLTASGQAMERAAPALLRLATGLWPAPLGGLRDALARRQERRRARDGLAMAKLAKRDGLSPSGRERLSALDARMARAPLPGRAMPTRLGSILRAAEDRPREWYGLDTAVCWPRLWPLLPEAQRADLKDAYKELALAVQAGAWSVLFALWALVLRPGLPVTLAVLAVAAAGLLAARAWSLQAAEVFADALMAAFDLHRAKLYESMRWPTPTTREQERTETGPRLTSYLWRRTLPADPAYEPWSPPAPAPKPPG